ncbi:hypothetical protein BDF19DRAFT_214401 [Syncephalis fuscata]|nr:hypothetical protein BDF19DRAFT_214401 [Syncephalis fuscata]
MEYNNNSYSTNNSSLQKARRPNKITKKNPNQRPALLRVSEDIDRDMLGNQRGAPSSPLPQNDTMDNSNELDPDVRRELRRRRHKLNKLFGEPLNEEMVFKQLVKPSLNSIGSTSEMMAVGVMSSTPVTSTAAAAITAATTTTTTVTITATAAAAAATKSPMSAPTPISAASITAIHSPSTTDFILDQSYLYDEEQQPQQSTSSSVATILLDSHSVRSRSMVSLLNRNSDNDTPNTSMRNRSISIDTVSTVTHHVPFNRSENRTMNTTNTNYTNEQQAREQRRKKVEKLFRVLGVHVPAEMINAAQERINSHRDTAPHAQTQYAQPLPTVVTAISVAVDDNGPNTMSMSASEKRAGVRRAEKLERMFGARPPQDLVVASTLPSPLSRDSCGDSAIVQLDTTSPSPASQRHSLLDLLDMEDDNYPAEGGYGMTDELGNTSLLSSSLPIDGASLISLLLEDDATVDSLLEYVSSPDISYEDPNTPEAIHDKSVRQRRLRKLKRFFGHELEETIM